MTALNTEQQIESALVAAGTPAPRLNPDYITSRIKKAEYVLLPDGRTTLCQLTLLNGFTVIGTSACVCKENYNQDVGESLAYSKAREQIWELEGYLLAERILMNDTLEDLSRKL